MLPLEPPCFLSGLESRFGVYELLRTRVVICTLSMERPSQTLMGTHLNSFFYLARILFFCTSSSFPTLMCVVLARFTSSNSIFFLVLYSEGGLLFSVFLYWQAAYSGLFLAGSIGELCSNEDCTYMMGSFAVSSSSFTLSSLAEVGFCTFSFPFSQLVVFCVLYVFNSNGLRGISVSCFAVCKCGDSSRIWGVVGLFEDTFRWLASSVSWRFVDNRLLLSLFGVCGVGMAKDFSDTSSIPAAESTVYIPCAEVWLIYYFLLWVIFFTCCILFLLSIIAVILTFREWSLSKSEGSAL